MLVGRCVVLRVCVYMEFTFLAISIRDINIGVREGGSGGSGEPPVGLETSGSLEVS